jgi:uncharacterized membrane protein YGL010W
VRSSLITFIRVCLPPVPSAVGQYNAIVGAHGGREIVSRIDALLEDYGSYHRTRGNLVCHAFGITLILYGTIALLQLIPLGARWTAAEAVIAASFLFYLTLSAPLAVPMLAETAGLDAVAGAIADWRVGAAAFVVGWIFQGLGHGLYERNSPAFLKNLAHLTVGPIFLWNEVLQVRSVPDKNA